MSQKLTNEELRLLHMKANSKVQLGALYKHTKSGKHYTVNIVSLREVDLEPLVTYSSITDPKIPFTRTAEEFSQRYTKMPPRW